MKKKLIIIILTILVIASCLPTVALANAAAPDSTGVGSGVTFDTYYDIEVASEVLDIVFSNRTATVTATYTMVNLTDDSLEVDTMFILPAEDTGKGYKCTVIQDGNTLMYTTSNYIYAGYNTSLTLDDWQYIVENGYEVDEYSMYELQIATVNYTMSFAPNATSTIVVSYDTQLGGEVSYSTTVELLYYLTPAQYWADFSDLTINLTLDELHPSLYTYSTSLDFTQTGEYTYQYTSDTLPDTELTIVARESSIERANYSLLMILVFVALPVGIVAVIGAVIAVVIVIIVRSIRYKKHGMCKLHNNKYYAKRGWAMLITFGALLIPTVIALLLKDIFVTMLLVVIYVDIVGVMALLVYNILLLDSYLRNNKAIRNADIEAIDADSDTTDII